MKRRAPLAFLLAAVLAVLLPFPLRAASQVTFRDFQVQGCRGANTFSNFFDSNGQPIIHTAKPDFFVWITTSGAPGLVNTAGGGNWPTPSALTVAGVQTLWNFDTDRTGSFEFDEAGGSSDLTPVAAAGSCANKDQTGSPVPGLDHFFQPSLGSVADLCHEEFNAGTGIPFQNFSNFTIEFWVRINGKGCVKSGACNAGDTVFFSQCPGGGTDKCLLAMVRDCVTSPASCKDSGGNMCGQTGFAGATYTPYFAFFNDDVCGGSIPGDNTWHHLAYVWNGSAKGIYLDGNLVSGGNLQNASAAYSGTGATTCIGSGCGGFASTTYLNGAIDAVRVYNIQLTQGTIAAHAMGQFYSVAGSTTMAACGTGGGGAGANQCPGSSFGSLAGNTIANPRAFLNNALTTNNGTSLLWGFGTDGTIVSSTATIGSNSQNPGNIIKTGGGQDSTVQFQFTEEDTTENIALPAVQKVTVRQQTMSVPPAFMITPRDQTTVSWASQGWFCDPYPNGIGNCNGALPCDGYDVRNNNVSYAYTLTNVSAGGTAFSGSNLGPNRTQLTLNPNTRYSLTATAKYTDSGGNNNVVGPSAQTVAVTTTTLAWPPDTPFAMTIVDSVTINMTLQTTKATIAGQACSADGTGSTQGTPCPNPNYTSINVEASNDAGNTFLTAVPFFSAGGQTPTVTVNGLNKSSKYLFRSRAENLDGLTTSPSANTTTPALNAPGITGPLTPVTLFGSSGVGDVVCPKTDIQWRWSSVPIGSNQAPSPSGLATMYRLNGSSATDTLDLSHIFKGSDPDCADCVANGATFYLEVGLSTNTQYFAQVRSFDGGAQKAGKDIRFSEASNFFSANTAPGDTFPPTSITPTSLVGQIQWTWTAPPNLCNPSTYLVYDQHTGAQIGNFNTPAPVVTFFQSPLGPNAQGCIAVKAQDIFATSSLSAAATGYSQAFPPQNGAIVGVSTGGIVFTWNTNTNPSYTRYEVSMSPDNFATGPAISTPIQITANFTGNAAAFTNLTPGTSYFFRVRAANGKATDSFGGIFTTFASAGGMTLWPAPVVAVNGAATTMTSIQFKWPTNNNVSAYNISQVGVGQVAQNLSPYANPSFYTLAGLTTNTRNGLVVTALNGQGLGNPSSPAFAYTLADAVAPLPVVGVTTNTITYAWNPNSNPAGTFYEVDVATNAQLSPLVATVTPGSPGATVTGLFPGTTYFGQVRAFNGDLIPVNPYVQFASTRTNVDGTVSTTSAPLTVYSIPQGAVGLWHFDESSGTVASDSSTVANPGALTCLYNACVSTPTWTAGPPGLGSAISLQGLTSSFVQIPDVAQYHFSTSLTLEAWVNPATVAQPNGAGIAVKGPFNGEDFYLDIAGGKYRFSACPGAGLGAPNAATAAAGIAAGQWTHLAGVYNSVSGVNTLFVNGVASPNVGAPCVRNGVITSAPFGVGSRRSATGAFDLGLQGAIDEVRLINGAETAAQVQADYLASMVSTITMVGGAAGLQVAVPPNAFGGPATIYASGDPVNHPLKISVPELLIGLANPPTGQTLISGTLFEIVPTVNGTQFTSLLGSSATVMISYLDSNNDGIVDNTNPPIAAKTLRVYTLDTALGQWVQLPTSLDAANHVIMGLTPHFSVFGAFGASTTGANATQARAYPNPWKIASGGRFDAANLTFDTLPSQGYIRIFNLSGQKIIELQFSGGNAGTVTWNGLNFAGRSAASGVYFAYVKSALDDSSQVIKFAIER